MEIQEFTLLMERFISYWFNKYSKVKIWPVIFYDSIKKVLIKMAVKLQRKN